MAKGKMFQMRMSDGETADLAKRAEAAGLSVAGLARALLFPADAPAAITTGDKIESPAAVARRKSKLCVACARTGRARWNCRACAAPQPA